MHSSKKEDMEQNLSKDQPACLEYKQNYKSWMDDDNEAMESEKEDADSSLSAYLMAVDNDAMESEKKDADSSSSANLEAKKELSIKKSVEKIRETEQSVKKQRQSSNKEDLEQKLLPVADDNEAMEPGKEDADSSLGKLDRTLSLHANLEAEDEPTINKLEEARETEQSVEIEETKTSLSSKKEDMKQKSPKEQSEQYVQVYEGSNKDGNTYEALKNKVKEMQKTIEYFMSMHSAEEKQSPSFNTIDDHTSPGDSFKMRRSRSCRENLLYTKAVAAAASGRFVFKTSNNTSFDSDITGSIDSQSTKDSDTETSSGSFHEFIAGLKQMAMQHHSTHESDTETEKMKLQKTDDSGTTKEFERQQSQIIELWAVCNVPLVHRTYFFLLFKGDPSDFVYMEVELRRLSFLKDSPEMLRKQTAKALAREREWLAKQIPKKYGKKEREEVYKKWGVELSSKQRSMQVTHKIWTNTKDVEHCKESASLVATLVGFDDSNLTPKEMFGLSFSPTTTLNIKSSGWRFSNSFSRISLTGGL